MTTLTMAKALNAGLRRALAADPKVLLAGEDIGKLGGVFRVTEGLQAEFGPDRVVDSPLAESGIVGHGGRAWPCAATVRWSRSSSTGSSTRPSTRSSRRCPGCVSVRTAG